jgi:hypothetical protein
MPPIAIHASRLKYALLLLAALGFVAGGVFIVLHGKPGDAWVGWMSILFFGAGIPLFGRQLLDARPRLVIDEHGILDRTLGVGVIPWSEITGASLGSVQGNHFICLELHHPESWLEKLSPIKRALVSANQALGFSALNLNLSAVAADPTEVLELIQKTIAAHHHGRD